MDPEAFAALIGACGEKAYNFAYRLTGNDQDARDLVQEAFARALKHYEKYDPSKPFDSWLNRILHNIYLDGVRLYSHNHTVSLDSTPPEAADASWEEILPSGEQEPLNDMIRQETDALLQAALNSLPIQFKTAITLCDIEGLPYERISEIMACPVGTVRSRIHQGRILVREALEKLQEGSLREGYHE